MSKSKSNCQQQTGFVNSNGVNLFFRERSPCKLDSSKPPLLFIHGLAFSSQVWQCQQRYFCCLGYRTVSFDLPGHGNSDKPTDPAQLSPQALLNDITAVITQLGLVRPVIIGHSISGLLTLLYALENQNNLTAIVTSGAFANLGQTTPAANAAIGQYLFENPNLQQFAVAFDSAAVTETQLSNCPGASLLLQKLIQITLQASLTSLQLILQGFLGDPTDLLPLLFNLTLPVLVIQGTIDNSVFPSAGDQIRDAINVGKGGAGLDNTANAALFEIRNRGHAPFDTEFKLFNRALKEFLQSETCNVCPFVKP